MDGSRLPSTYAGGGDLRLLRVGLQTRGEDLTTRPDAALTFVVDVSGSMGEPGRLDLVRDALHYAGRAAASDRTGSRSSPTTTGPASCDR